MDAEQRKTNIFVSSVSIIYSLFSVWTPEAVHNLPAVASEIQLMGLMNQGTITLAKSCCDLSGGKGILEFRNVLCYAKAHNARGDMDIM